MKGLLIRTDGTAEEVDLGETGDGGVFRAIEKLIGAEMLDTVNLRDGRVMIVDDGGYETEEIRHSESHVELRPVRARKLENPMATKLYHAVCVPGTTHKIVGDVVIVWDA